MSERDCLCVNVCVWFVQNFVVVVVVISFDFICVPLYWVRFIFPLSCLSFLSSFPIVFSASLWRTFYFMLTHAHNVVSAYAKAIIDTVTTLFDPKQSSNSKRCIGVRMCVSTQTCLRACMLTCMYLSTFYKTINTHLFRPSIFFSHRSSVVQRCVRECAYTHTACTYGCICACLLAS